jgi:methyl-accepting chemotaxis protein
MRKIRLGVTQKIFLVIIPLFIFLILAISIPITNLFTGVVYSTAEEQALTGAQGLLEMLHMESIRAKNGALALSFHQGVAQALQEKDRESLSKILAPLLKELELDFVTCSNSEGTVVFRSHNPEKFGDSVASQANVKAAMGGKILAAMEAGTAVPLSARAGAPVYLDGRLVGVISTGIRLDTPVFVDTMKERFAADFTIFLGNVRLMTTIQQNGKRAVGTTLDPSVAEEVLTRGRTFTGRADILGIPYITAYIPLKGPSGDIIGISFAGRSVDNLRQISRQVLLLTLGVATGGLLLAILLMAFLVRRILKPLKRMSLLTEQLARGNLTIRSEVHSKDEFGDLAGNLDHMVQELHNLLKGIASVAEILVKNAEDFSAVAEETNASVEEARSGAETVGSSMDTIAAIGEELNASVEEVASGASTVATRSTEVAEEVESARSAGEAGMNAVGQTVKDMAEQILRVEESAKATEELGEKAAQIQKIVVTITGIADQTNLLALNAAIEAARAGEAGRGFAVVAEEVRKLAEESNNAARNIADLASSIAADLSSVKEGAQRSRQGAQNVDDNIRNVSEKIALIMEALEKIASSAQDLAAVGQEQAASSEEIAAAVQDMAQKVNDSTGVAESLRGQMGEVAGAAERVALGGEEMARISEDLQRRLAAFVLDKQEQTYQEPSRALERSYKS